MGWPSMRFCTCRTSHGASINEAVEIAKKYETPETVKFINGILGTFVRRETAE